MTSHKREKAIRDAFAQEMAEKTEELVRAGGLSGGAADTIKREILGISV
ncbi:Protein of uncharacterised function (DUF3486) [Shigella sonnei]|nr:Protein of uncharacterised function (DUF3486) [Shigella sonnei]